MALDGKTTAREAHEGLRLVAKAISESHPDGARRLRALAEALGSAPPEAEAWEWLTANGHPKVPLALAFESDPRK